MKGAWKASDKRRKELIIDLKILREMYEEAENDIAIIYLQCINKLEAELHQILEADRRCGLKKIADHELHLRKGEN